MAEVPGRTELNDGDLFAGYRVERRLGRGGMGVLYLAIEPGLERRVALKLIAPEAAADEVFAKRFAEESRIAASIEHPNVVPIYAAGEEEGVPFIAMRYVAGSDLGRRLADQDKLAPAEAVALIAQVGNGLDAIHRAGLVHRDVKPANVLLSGVGVDAHAYITDFGVARNVATESGLTQTGRFVGTLDYVAPEQISGRAVDARVDVYALGCLLFKLLTGEVPFPREGDAARLYAHLNDPPPAPSLYVPAVSMALDDVVVRAMSKQPEDRYPSAGDLGRAAEAALRGGQVSLPERTVATGAAATRTAATKQPEPTAATRVAAVEGESSGRRRRLFLLAGLAGLVAAGIAVAAIALPGSGGDDGGGGTETGATATTTNEVPPKQEKPKPVSSAELIRQADEVCTRSQDRYLSVRDLEREFTTDPEYAEALVEIAEPRIRGLRRLQGEAPPSLAGPYREYVKAQERVLETDREALTAAREGDLAGVEAARARRDSEDALREELAQEIGFETCSVPKS
ncbi:MAG TPA: serine/threonine-protein kinase [Solirubrobacterales bacterium]|nr:serine/threonine-protein kinase [Solirubrobacterales bacterium]